MDRDVGREIDLHQVRRVAEVRAHAANELLDAGWVLHDIYFSSETGEYRSHYIVLCLDDITCPKCGGPANIEILECGERVRFICTKECAYSPTYDGLDITLDRTI